VGFSHIGVGLGYWGLKVGLLGRFFLGFFGQKSTESKIFGQKSTESFFQFNQQ
jgi:hypothetical protein